MTGSDRSNPPEGYRLERGYLWPAEDRECAAVVFDMTKDLEIAYRAVEERGQGFRVAVQAGGNCGVWPKIMGERFETVYTFEADPVNFRCLCANAPAENIFKVNAALGFQRGCVDLARDPANIGAHYVHRSGAIPVLQIDDLCLDACDLIYLDIEGFELKALHGGAETITRHRPVIVVEDKGLSSRYGSPKGEIERWLQCFGYRVAARPHRDVVLVPS